MFLSTVITSAKDVMFLHFVHPSVSRIIQKVVDKFWWNFWRCEMIRFWWWSGSQCCYGNFYHCGIGKLIQILLITQGGVDKFLRNFFGGWDVSLAKKHSNFVLIQITIRLQNFLTEFYHIRIKAIARILFPTLQIMTTILRGVMSCLGRRLCSNQCPSNSIINDARTASIDELVVPNLAARHCVHLKRLYCLLRQ